MPEARAREQLCFEVFSPSDRKKRHTYVPFDPADPKTVTAAVQRARRVFEAGMRPAEVWTCVALPRGGFKRRYLMLRITDDTPWDAALRRLRRTCLEAWADPGDYDRAEARKQRDVEADRASAARVREQTAERRETIAEIFAEAQTLADHAPTPRAHIPDVDLDGFMAGTVLDDEPVDYEEQAHVLTNEGEAVDMVPGLRRTRDVRLGHSEGEGW